MAISSWTSQKVLEEPKTRTVYDGAGNSLKLREADKIGEGGEAIVYAVPGHDDLVVKLWRRSTMEDSVKCAEAGRRLEAQVKMTPVKNLAFLAWPQYVAYDAHRKPCGCVMRKMPGGVSLASFMNGDAGIRAAFPKQADRRLLAKVARAYVDEIVQMSEYGVAPCDFNPRNVLVSLTPSGDPSVSFIDTDSFQFTDPSGKTWTSSAHLPAYLAPELFAPGALGRPRSNTSTEFSAALVVFAILTLGGSPYTFVEARDGSVMGDVVANLKRGLCGLGGGNDNAKLPPRLWAQVHEMVYTLKDYNVRMFVQGHSNVAARPPLRDLLQELDKFIYTLDHDPTRWPLVPQHTEKRVWLGANAPRSQMHPDCGPRIGYAPRTGYAPQTAFQRPYVKFRPGFGPRLKPKCGNFYPEY